MTTKKPTLLIRPRDDTKAALKKAADAEDRSMAWIADRAIVEWLERNGYLKPTKKPRA
jgi:predicted transcriptional regulator